MGLIAAPTGGEECRSGECAAGLFAALGSRARLAIVRALGTQVRLDVGRIAAPPIVELDNRAEQICR